MAIIIIKPGRPPEMAVISHTCRNCKCEFTFNPPDAVRENDQRECIQSVR